MDPIFVHGANRAFIIEERTRGWVDTTSGSPYYCLRHCASGSVLWGLWQRTGSDGHEERFITCDILVSSRVGWGYRALLESDELPHLSCPRAYLRASAPISERWRAQVEEYWRTPLRSGLRVQRLLARKGNALLREGDRVRFIHVGSNAAGNLGTVISMMGAAGPTVHADELCRTTFVKWDGGIAEPVFTTRLERLPATGCADSQSKPV